MKKLLVLCVLFLALSACANGAQKAFLGLPPQCTQLNAPVAELQDGRTAYAPFLVCTDKYEPLPLAPEQKAGK